MRQLQSNDQISFNRDVRPILNKNCLRCHGGIKANGGFSMLFEEDAFAETKSGLLAIIPGDGDYGTKARIWKYHQNYLSGLHHFMSTDPRIPEDFRIKTSNLGL